LDEEFTILLGSGKAVDKFGKGRHLFSTRVRCARGHVGLLVPTQKTGRLPKPR